MFFIAVQTAAGLVENFENFFDHIFWRKVANPQSGEIEDILDPELLGHHMDVGAYIIPSQISIIPLKNC